MKTDPNFIPDPPDRNGAAGRESINRANSSPTEETTTLFDNKNRNYTAPSLYTDTTYSFYDRSSLEATKRLRLMLQRWVDRLPPAKQKDIVKRMRHTGRGSPAKEQSFTGALLELFLHEFLNGTGGYTVMEPKIGRLTPDFEVTETGPDGTKINYIVEATDIDYTRGTGLESNWNEQNVLDVLNEIESPDYFLWIDTTGSLTTTPPKRKLKEPFENLVNTANYDDIIAKGDNATPTATFQHSDWSISGCLIPVAPEHRPKKGEFISNGPPKFGWFNNFARTKTRLYEKAKRYQNTDNLIIALRADRLGQSISETLFGSTEIQISIPNNPDSTKPVPPPRSSRRLDGFWINTHGPQNRHVIGVVVFHQLYPHCIDHATAEFYANPYIEKPMPAWTKMVDHAEYANNQIEIVKGLSPGAFAKDYEPIADFGFY